MWEIQDVTINNYVVFFWPLAMPLLYAFLEFEKAKNFGDEFLFNVEKARKNKLDKFCSKCLDTFHFSLTNLCLSMALVPSVVLLRFPKM